MTNDKENNKQLENINTWLDTLQPIKEDLHKPVIKHFFNRGMALLTSFILYIIGIAFLLLPFVVNKINPFQVLNFVQNTKEVVTVIGSQQTANMFVYAVYGLLVLIGILLIIIGLQVSKNNANNIVQYKTSTQVKKLYQQLLDAKKHLEKNIDKPVLLHEKEAKDFTDLGLEI